MTPAQINQAASKHTEESLDGWVVTFGSPPGMKSGVMIAAADRNGRSYAIGCGDTELEAMNALLSDMTARARSWIKLRRLARTWRDRLRKESQDRRAEESSAFFQRKKTSKKNHD